MLTVTQQFLPFQKLNNVIEKRGIFCLFKLPDFTGNLLSLFANFECVFSKTEISNIILIANTNYFIKNLSVSVDYYMSWAKKTSLPDLSGHYQRRHLRISERNGGSRRRLRLEPPVQLELQSGGRREESGGRSACPHAHHAWRPLLSKQRVLSQPRRIWPRYEEWRSTNLCRLAGYSFLASEDRTIGKGWEGKAFIQPLRIPPGLQPLLSK